MKFTERALILLLTAVLLFPSCASEKPVNTEPETAVQNEDASQDAAEKTPEPEETEVTRETVKDDLPERDFNGYEFKIVTRVRDDFIMDIGSELELNGEIVNDAYYNRNLTVSDRFNIKISGVYPGPNGSDVHSAMQEAVMAGDDAYAVGMNQSNNMDVVGLSGIYLDWHTQLPYVNLKKPWYIGNAAEALTVHGHAYAMAGEFNMDILRFTSCFYYNQDIAKEYDLEDIYAVVREGRWTLDALETLADTVYIDLNSNGKKDFKDRLAVSGDPFDAAIAYQYGFDIMIAKQDSEGFPTLAIDVEKAHDSIVRLNAVYWESAGGLTEGWSSGEDTWAAGNLLCLPALFRNATTFGDLEFDYAIIPYPKYDEVQKNYVSSVPGAADLQSVPISVRDPEMVSIIVEALNCESYKQVVPAYYEISLKNRYSRDEESSRMLDLLMECRVFDFGFLHDATKIRKVFWDSISTNSNDVASAYATLIPATEQLYKDLIEGYLKVEEQLGK